MGLSDACWHFLEEVEDATRKLDEEVRRYSSPEYPVRYGEEANALLRAIARASDVQDDPEAVALLIRLAAAVMHRHDVSPNHPDEPELRREMEALVRLVLAEPGRDDA